MPTKTSFSLGDALHIETVSSLYDRLQKALKKSSVIEIKADKVTKVDSAGLQLIACLMAEVKAKDGRIVWKNPSACLLDTAKIIGLTVYLGLSG